jgi:hypothetical protein
MIMVNLETDKFFIFTPFIIYSGIIYLPGIERKLEIFF